MALVVFKGAPGSKFNWSGGSLEPNVPTPMDTIPDELKGFIISQGKSPSKARFLEILDWTEELKEELGKTKAGKKGSSKAKKSSSSEVDGNE